MLTPIYAGAVFLIYSQLQQVAVNPGLILLLAFWSLTFPLVVSELADLLQQLPRSRNVVLRVMELFRTQELEEEDQTAVYQSPVTLTFQDVTVTRSNLPVLSGLNLHVRAGEQIAVVGSSGSGKSSLFAMLCGFLDIDQGQLLIDENTATPSALNALRDATVAIDAELYLWNRSLIDNLLFVDPQPADLEGVLNKSGVQQDLTRLPKGLITPVGEDGARLSGGEGQRLRIARGLLSADPALVLLDEPFRGLAREQRQTMLARLRSWYPRVTLLFISHDVQDAYQFERVWIMADGCVVEDGDPRQLARQEQSEFVALLEAQQSLEADFDDKWDSLELADGKVEVA